MKSSAQVVVIGGGVVGASVLYHLTKVGLTDVMLVERSELTSGSTWHAAGGMHTFNGDPNVAALQQYTVALYEEIERISGHDCGIHLTGGLMLADTEERMDWLRMAHARGRYLGMDTELLGVAEAKKILPIMDERHFVGALYDAMEGHVDPSGVTWAYARAAQLAGAEVVQHTRVEAIRQRPDGLWDLDCGEAGTTTCEHFVNAGGLWAREVGRMCGIELPVLAMEHMYLLTESVPELEDWTATGPGSGLHTMDFAGEVYLRKEGTGLLLGTYEPDGVPWSPHTTPWEFGHQLLPPDLDRIADNLQVAFEHFPIFYDIGIKTVINGPFSFAPDGNPLIGPIRGQRGHWVACGVMAGLSQGGGVGLALSNWIAEGDPGFDVWAMDVARFGDFATPAYTNAKVRENYARRFRIPYPNEELPAGRPLMTSPIHERLHRANAVWGAAYGLEYALWFQRDGLEAYEMPTLRRSNAWDMAAEESRAVREGVGLYETTGFAKFVFTGPGARVFLDSIMGNRIPPVGRIALTPMLNEHGRLIGDLTVATLPPTPGDVAERSSERFMVFGTGAAERYYERWFDAHLPADGSVRYASMGPNLCGLSIAGPASRALLADVTDADVSAESVRFLDFRRIEVGAVPVVLGRISFTGDLGYELWVEPAYQPQLFDVLTAAGARYGLRLFGLRALDSLRFDKSFGAWAFEYRPIYDPYEAGLGMFVKLDKGAFVGRDAAARRRAEGPERRLTAFTIDADDADATADEPIWHDDEVVGWVTSGGYAHWSQASVALGYVPAGLADATDGFEIEVVGDRRPATRLDECLFDPTGSRMRA
ncbi:MAG: FAD-dependent oxidoreductase [Actinobacteria bacterium]|nr:FAD-dependent oxidoreductase [Actinomycetota bacterium]